MAIPSLLVKRLHEMTEKIELKDGYALMVNLIFTADEETYAHNHVKVDYAVYGKCGTTDSYHATRYYSLDTSLTTLLLNIEDDIKISIKKYLKPKRITLSQIIVKLKDFLGDDVWYDGYDDKICDLCGEWISFYPLKGKTFFTEEDYDEISDFLLNDRGEKFLIDKHFNQFMDYMIRVKDARVIYWKNDKAGLDLPLENDGRIFMSTFDLTAFSSVRNFLDWYEKRYAFKENKEFEHIDLDEFDVDDFDADEFTED